MYGGKWVPARLHAPGSGDEFHLGPHIMILGLDQLLRTFNQDGSNGEPYADHLDGPHSELFLVIPIRAWDDPRVAARVGAVVRGFEEM
jgi:hypothetical protein